VRKDVPILLTATLDARSHGRTGCTLLQRVARPAEWLPGWVTRWCQAMTDAVGGSLSEPAWRTPAVTFQVRTERPPPGALGAKLMDMDAALAGLLGASIGAIAGILGGFIAGWQQRKVEVLRWKQERADELRKEERPSLLELTSLLAEGSQAMAWLCWAATAKSAEAVKADAHEYDARMRALMPRLFSAQAAASGLSEEAFSQIDPLVQRLLSLDTKLGNASVRLDIEPDEALQELKGFVGPAYQLTRDVVLGVRSQLRVDRSEAIPNIDALDGS